MCGGGWVGGSYEHAQYSTEGGGCIYEHTQHRKGGEGEIIQAHTAQKGEGDVGGIPSAHAAHPLVRKGLSPTSTDITR